MRGRHAPRRRGGHRDADRPEGIGEPHATWTTSPLDCTGSDIDAGGKTARRSIERAAPPIAWTEPQPACGSWSDTLTIADSEVRKVDPRFIRAGHRAIQPVLWLVVFGEVLAQTRAISTGSLRLLDFLTPGVLAQSALFIAIFSGIAVIWERDLGVVQRCSSARPRGRLLVLGKAIAGGLKGLAQRSLSSSWRPSSASTSASIRSPCSRSAASWSWLGALRHLFHGRGLHRPHARTVHGHRPGDDHAPLLRQQRDLPRLGHAELAVRRSPRQPLTYMVDAIRGLMVVAAERATAAAGHVGAGGGPWWSWWHSPRALYPRPGPVGPRATAAPPSRPVGAACPASAWG